MVELTPDEVAVVQRELDAMLAAGDDDEAWRILRLFADGVFRPGLEDLPVPLQNRFVALGPERRRSYPALLERVRALEREDGRDGGPAFSCIEIGRLSHGGQVYPLVKLVSRPPAAADAANVPICLVGGLHGDERDSIEAPLELARRFARSAELRATYELTIYPCLNPVGYERMTRANGRGKDLNREFQQDTYVEEVRVMLRELATHRYIGFLSPHSDYESFGLYAYATGAVLSERLAKPALFQASGIIPINTDPIIDGHPAELGIISEEVPGAFGPLTRRRPEPFDIVLETPNLFAVSKRVEAHAIALETVLHEYRAVAAEAMHL